MRPRHTVQLEVLCKGSIALRPRSELCHRFHFAVIGHAIISVGQEFKGLQHWEAFVYNTSTV